MFVRDAAPRLVFALVLLALPACSEPAPSVDGVGLDIPPPRPRERVQRDSMFDGNGVPLPSEIVVAGLTLPLGLEAMEALSSERRHQYASAVPPGPLLRYFGPRLTTVQIEQDGEQVSYRAAIPREARGAVVQLDVTIRPSSAHAARVEIYERPPPAPEGVTVDPATIRRHLDRELDPSRRE